MTIGCVADDYTGATDAASAFRAAGLRTRIHFGVPTSSSTETAADAGVVALRIRALDPDAAVSAATRAARWLSDSVLLHKICSTFDSTEVGNIGPVADALVDLIGATMALVCPAAPRHRRTVYMGHLFVGDRLLSESTMRTHPLNPMRDADLVRLLGRQTAHPVALLPHDVVRNGPTEIRQRLADLERDGVRHVVADAVDDADLDSLAAAAVSRRSLLVGSAGLAEALGRGTAPTVAAPADGEPPVATGPAVVLAGSCSPATMAQVAAIAAHWPTYRLDPRSDPEFESMLARAVRWLDGHGRGVPRIVYSGAPPEERDPTLAAVVERAMGRLAAHVVAGGTRRLVVAGGETAGSVVDALGIGSAVVGVELAPGVPWLATTDPLRLSLLLKSGNFGRPDLLVRAIREVG